VASIAQRGLLAFLATAEPHPGAFLGHELDRLEARIAMGTVAEWLAGAATAGTPPVFAALLHLDDDGFVAGTGGLFQDLSPC